MAVVWGLALFALLFTEMFTMEFTCLSLAAGCLLGLGVALIDGPLWLQAVGAIGGSVASLVLMAPLLRRRLTPSDTATAVDLIVGSEAEVIEDIVPPAQGKVKLDGVTWQATAHCPIPAGSRVVITELDGAYLTVMAKSEFLPQRHSQPLSQTEETARPQPQSDLLT